MGTTALQTNTFQRCAVCKIDLKGRFVYIDEEVETLLGVTKEELFGKSILEFLSAPSKSIIKELILRRNHYESFYDATSFTLLNVNQQPINAQVVVSLNFIAGNPVNYQLIINVPDGSTTTANVGSCMSHDEFLEQLLAIENIHDFKQIATLTRSFVGCRALLIYLASVETLEPRAASSVLDLPQDELFLSAPELTDLHQAVIESSEPYNFLDDTSAMSAIELIGKSPNEILIPTNLPDGTTWLYRFIFDAELTVDPSATTTRVNTALSLIRRLAEPVSTNNGSEDQSFDIKFTVGFLDSISIGALILDEKGDISGYNPTFMKLMDQESIQGHLTSALDILATCNDKSAISAIEQYYRANLEEEELFDLTQSISLPTGDEAKLVAVRFSVDPADSSSCIVFIPQGKSPELKQEIPVDNKLLTEIVSAIAPVSDHIEQVSSSIGHQYYNQLDDQANVLLKSLSRQSRELSNYLADLIGSLAPRKNSSQSSSIVDLGLLTGQIVDDISRQFPGSKINCVCHDLPKVKTATHVVGQVIRYVIATGLKYSPGNNLKFRVKASLNADKCRLIFSRLGRKVPAKLRESLQGLGAGEEALIVDQQRELSLLTTRLLLQQIGGTIEIEDGDHGFEEISVSIPDYSSKGE